MCNSGYVENEFFFNFTRYNGFILHFITVFSTDKCEVKDGEIYILLL